MDRRIGAVEQADLVRLQPRATAPFQQVGHHGIPQPVVLRIDGDLLSAEAPQGLGHQGAGADGVLVEIQPKHRATPFQRSAVGLELLHSRACRRRCGAISGGHQQGRSGNDGEPAKGGELA